MTDKQLQIPIDKIKADFQQFLAPEHNRRIIFSGPFGVGKTYFLNEFFKEKEDEYFPIFLRPINYSLLSNEDVFKFIKYDILAQLIQDENFNIEEEFDFTKTEYLNHFLSENRFLILKNLLKAIPKIRNVISAAEELENLFSKYKEGLDKINSSPELEMLKNFQQESESNFLLEYDEVSEYISLKLDEIIELKKGGETKTKKVLIIDDLDRLDPEHIFRLFNIFSAHFDQVHYYENEDGNDNKFGFDKIIFVCDIVNIRKIFAHKYGNEVDFTGYIDKFYSKEIYYLFHKDVFNDVIYPFIDRKLQIRSHDGPTINISKCLKYTLKLLFGGNEISVRMLKRIESYSPSFTDNENKILYHPILFTRFGAKVDSVLKSYQLLIVLKFYLDLFSSREEVVRKFKKAILSFSERDDIYENHYYKQILAEAILFADLETHKFQLSTKEELKEFEYSEPSILYKVSGGYYDSIWNEGEMYYIVNLTTSLEVITNGIFYPILVNAVESIFRKGII